MDHDSQKVKDIQSSEMSFVRRVEGCTRSDRIRNEDIRHELQVYNINEKTESYKENRKHHVERLMELGYINKY